MSFGAHAVPRLRCCCCSALARPVSHNQQLTSPALGALWARYASICSVCRSYSRSCGGPGRHYSTVGNPPAASAEEVRVPCRSDGEITLSIFHPVVTEDPTSPLILYLPTAPRADERFEANDEKIIAALSAASNGTIVRLNYRLGDEVQYPTPIHDVLTGYDYVKERFALETWTTRSGRLKKKHLRIGVCGQLVGGSLAAMLGLTESRLAEDRIAAAALNCPIVDWVFPERAQGDAVGNTVDQDSTDQVLQKVVRRRRKKAVQLPSWDAFGDTGSLTTRKLEAARSAFFRKPANYFDHFATPTHFLRSAGVEVPKEKTVDMNELELLSPSPKPRKTKRNFPPSNSSLIVPHVRLSVGEANPLLDQDEEFVKLLRRSVVRTVENRASTQALLDRFDETPATDMDRLEMAVAAAEEKIEYHIQSGAGLWGTPQNEEWLDEVWKVGKWFRKILG